MFVKVCGITKKEYIDWAVELGFTAIGVVFYPKSKRFVGVDEGIEFGRYAKGKIKTVAVGIDYKDVETAVDYFDYFQITEFVRDERLIYSIEEKPTYDAKMYIFDKSKGSGLFSEIPEWFNEIRGNTVIAGGLTPNNVSEVIEKYQPFGVDVSSGVEISSGVKSKELMEKFINMANRWRSK